MLESLWAMESKKSTRSHEGESEKNWKSDCWQTAGWGLVLHLEDWSGYKYENHVYNHTIIISSYLWLTWWCLNLHIIIIGVSFSPWWILIKVIIKFAITIAREVFMKPKAGTGVARPIANMWERKCCNSCRCTGSKIEQVEIVKN